jgi:hypothetical protein
VCEWQVAMLMWLNFVLRALLTIPVGAALVLAKGVLAG